MPDNLVTARFPPDLAAAVKAYAEKEGTSVSEVLRQGALGLLGFCPTCGQAWGRGHDDAG